MVTSAYGEEREPDRKAEPRTEILGGGRGGENPRKFSLFSTVATQNATITAYVRHILLQSEQNIVLYSTFLTKYSTL